MARSTTYQVVNVGYVTLHGKPAAGRMGFSKNQRLENTRQRIYNGSLCGSTPARGRVSLSMGKRVEGIEPS